MEVALATPGEHVITCTATDADGNTGSASITVVAASPLAESWHPGDGELTAAIAWSSDLDGAFGTGTGFSAALTTVGLHTITALVTNSLGDTATATLQLDVVAP